MSSKVLLYKILILFVDFLNYIGNNYQEIKTLLKLYKDFNEDIFHESIIKCNQIIKNNKLIFNTDNDILRYFIGSYKTNLLRDKLYYYNKNSVNGLEISEYDREDANNIEENTSLELINNKITQKFGIELSNVFSRYIEEEICIEKLLKETKIKNLKLKIKNIKDFIINEYKKEEI